jgi:hypothetical protein
MDERFLVFDAISFSLVFGFIRVLKWLSWIDFTLEFLTYIIFGSETKKESLRIVPSFVFSFLWSSIFSKGLSIFLISIFSDEKNDCILGLISSKLCSIN